MRDKDRGRVGNSAYTNVHLVVTLTVGLHELEYKN